MKAGDIDPIIDVVSVIVRSPSLETYRIGITKDRRRRRNQYLTASAPKPWPHMVFMAFDLDMQKAQAMEREVFERCVSATRSVLYKKYDQVVRDRPYVRSAGGRTSDDQSPFCLYMAWCNR